MTNAEKTHYIVMFSRQGQGGYHERYFFGKSAADKFAAEKTAEGFTASSFPRF